MPHPDAAQVIMLDAYGVATGFTLDGTSDCCPEYRVHTPLGVAATGLGGMYNGGGVAIDIDGECVHHETFAQHALP